MEIPNFIVDGVNLKLERILFFYEIPVFFVCNNGKKDLYLVYCSDIDELQYSIISISCNELIDVLDNKTPLDKVFHNSPRKFKVCVEDYSRPVTILETDEYVKDELPKEGAFYGKLDSEVKKYLEQLRTRSLSNLARVIIAKTFFTNHIERIARYIFYKDWEMPLSSKAYKEEFSRTANYNREIVHA